MAEYGVVHVAVAYWWEEHTGGIKGDGAEDCEVCASGADTLSEIFMADAAWAGLETALATASNDAGEPLKTDGFGLDDIDDDVADSFAREVAEFCHTMCRDLDESKAGQTGHDFVLTRNGDGAGFWDGDWGDAGDRLTEACQTYGGFNLYAGDDGKLYAHS